MEFLVDVPIYVRFLSNDDASDDFRTLRAFIAISLIRVYLNVFAIRVKYSSCLSDSVQQATKLNAI